MRLSQRQIQHLNWRGGFGLNLSSIKMQSGESKEQIVDRFFEQSESYESFQLDQSMDEYIGKFPRMSAEQRKEAGKISLRNIRQLNFSWMTSMVQGEGALREKMALFWHDHFACSSNNAIFVLKYLNTIRKHALGNFRDLLKDISKEPAMLQFLNNQQNRKQSPNENFAREVMELFTLGQGNYNEKDIKEAARAFTGWGFSREAEFVFRSMQHDYGTKEIFGKRGSFDGDDVLEMLLDNPRTAWYITQKLYTYLVNPKPDEEIIQSLSESFYQSDYDIKALLKEIFESDWFYNEANIGVKIKSPTELLVGIQKAFYVELKEPDPSIYIQNILGQKLLFPPNVAGWKGGTSWIDSSTILTRTRLTGMLLTAGALNVRAKDSGDDNDIFRNMKQLRKIGSHLDHEKLMSDMRELSSTEELQHFMFQVPAQASRQNLKNKDQEVILRSINQLSRLPEFQLC